MWFVPILHSATMHDQQLSEQPTSGVETATAILSAPNIHPVTPVHHAVATAGMKRVAQCTW